MSRHERVNKTPLPDETHFIVTPTQRAKKATDAADSDRPSGSGEDPLPIAMSSPTAAPVQLPTCALRPPRVRSTASFAYPPFFSIFF